MEKLDFQTFLFQNNNKKLPLKNVCMSVNKVAILCFRQNKIMKAPGGEKRKQVRQLKSAEVYFLTKLRTLYLRLLIKKLKNRKNKKKQRAATPNIDVVQFIIVYRML